VAADVAGAARDQDRAHQRGHHPLVLLVVVQD
jgi:hypothetical protein